ncbi:MAG TPA: HD domain-containing protein [Arthrobacter sp.]
MTTNSTVTAPRQPRGVPTGGEYAAYAHAEGVALRPGTVIPDLIELTPETQSVLDACRAAGGRPLIVGGSVRDALFSRAQGEHVAPKDVDIEVHGLEDTAALKKELGRLGAVGEHGASFGVLGVQVNGQDFDITLPRRDSKTGDGHRGFEVEVDPGLGVEEAFSRRDFTINAMGWDDRTGELVDPFGGRADLDAGILRHTSDAFSEDPLRVLRGVQFAGRFSLVLDPDTATLCQQMAPSFAELPKERVWGEFHKLATKGTDITRALNALHASGWEQHFPGLAATRGVPQDLRWHPEGDVNVHLGLAGDQAAAIARRDGLDEEETSILVLAAITHDFGKAVSTKTSPDGTITSGGHHETGVEPAREFLAGIGAPGKYHEKILPLVREHMCHTPGGGVEISPSAVRRLLRRLDNAGGGPTLKQWSLLVEADKAGRGPGARHSRNYLSDWLTVAEKLGNETAISKTLLKGPHLAEAGIPRGKLWAIIVSQSEEAQDDGAFSDEAGAQAWLSANEAEIMAEATRRLQKAEAAYAKKKAAQDLVTAARVTEQKAQAKAVRAAKREAEQAAAAAS